LEQEDVVAREVFPPPLGHHQVGVALDLDRKKVGGGGGGEGGRKSSRKKEMSNQKISSIEDDAYIRTPL